MNGGAGPVSYPKGFKFPGTPVFVEDRRNTTPGSEQELIKFNVPNDKTRNLYQVVISCKMASRFSVVADGDIIGSGQTEAGKPDSTFVWIPPRPVDSGKEVKILFTSRCGSPVVEVDAYVQASDINC